MKRLIVLSLIVGVLSGCPSGGGGSSGTHKEGDGHDHGAHKEGDGHDHGGKAPATTTHKEGDGHDDHGTDKKGG